MYDYKVTCYIDGKLAWMCSSVESWPTRESAIQGARTQAMALNMGLPGFSFEKTAKGAKVWFDNFGHRVSKIYEV
jgi:hypothetical protein